MHAATRAAFFDELSKIAAKMDPRLFKQFAAHPSASPLTPQSTQVLSKAKMLKRPPLAVPKPADVGGHAWVPKKAIDL